MDHAEYQKKTRKMTIDQLIYTIVDANQAMLASPDSPNSGYYADEINYCVMEVKRRQDRLEQLHNVAIDFTAGLFNQAENNDYGWQPIPVEWMQEINP